MRALALDLRGTEAVLRQAFLLTRGAQYASSSGAQAEAETMFLGTTQMSNLADWELCPI
jgi:hypothetical protein